MENNMDPVKFFLRKIRVSTRNRRPTPLQDPLAVER